MNILFIAYSCSPNRGSEDRIGWQLPLAAAEKNRVFVLTKEEHRAEIEEWCAHHDLFAVRFCYVDIPSAAKRAFRGSAYSLRLNLWHRQALPVAEAICRRESIDLIHQITPVEFRSIGDYGKIPNAKFVCGPLGGGEDVPPELRGYAEHHLPAEAVRKGMNLLARRCLKRRGILNRCDALLFANAETEVWLNYVLIEGTSFGIYPEVGISREEIVHRKENRGACHFIVPGRLIYRKGHALLLDALAQLPKAILWCCTIVGDGPEKGRLQRQCEKTGLANRVTFLSKVSFSEMDQIYASTHVLVLPSLRETTGSVILEAMARGLPVIAPDRFGGAALTDDSTGWRFRTRDDLRDALMDCIQNPEEVHIRGRNAALAAQNHTWQQKAACYQQIYEKILTPEG